MKFALTAAAILAACALPGMARADAIIPGYFGGIVDDGSNTGVAPQNTTFVPGDPITGNFTFDATTDTFTSFQIGGYSAAPGYTSTLSPPLAATSYAYIGVENPVANAGPSDLLQINFYYETTPGPSTVDIAAFIANPGPFSQDLSGGSPSFFSAFLTNPDGSITQVGALLTSFAVPEPADLLVMLPALAGLGLVRRRIG